MKIKSSVLALIENFGLLDAAVVLETLIFHGCGKFTQCLTRHFEFLQSETWDLNLSLFVFASSFPNLTWDNELLPPCAKSGLYNT